MKHLFASLVWLLGWLPTAANAQSKPDLVIMAPVNVPSYVLTGGIYPMSAVIKNQGTNGSQFNCIGFYLSADNVWDATDAYLGASCQSLMFPGQSGTCSISATIPPLAPAGSRFIILVADPLNAENELDETNNVLSVAVTVAANTGTALPDLQLWRPSISFSAVPPGGSTGSFTFINNWGTGSVGSYELGFYLSADTVFSASTDVFLGLVTGGSLAASGGGTINSAPVLTIPATTVPGNYYLVLMADPRNVIVESNEANNSRALPLRVLGNATAAATAAATGVAVYPNPVAQGAALTVWLANGQQATLEMTCYNATGQLVCRQAGVGPAATLDARAWPPGIYTVRIVGNGFAYTHRVVVE